MVTHSSTGTSTASTAQSWSARNKVAYAHSKQLYQDGRIDTGTRESFEQLVKLCGPNTYSDVIEQTLATKCGVARRTVQERLRRMKDAGLIRVEEIGNRRRKHIVAWDAPKPETEMQPENDPDVLLSLAAQECAAGKFERGQALAFQAAMLKAGLFFSPDLNDPEIAHSAQDRSSSSFKEDLIKDLKEADRPRGAASISEPEEKSETVELLRTEGCSEVAIRELGHLDPNHVRQVFAAVEPRARDRAALGVHVLRYGLWDRPSPRPVTRAAPSEPDYAAYAASMGSLCPTCLRNCRPEWEGHCPHCELELFGRGET